MRDFLEYNLTFLEENPGYVASTSPNGMETIDGSYPKMSVFSLEGVWSNASSISSIIAGSHTEFFMHLFEHAY